MSDEMVEHVMEAFKRSPTTSICRASLELNIPRSTVHKVLHERLHLQSPNCPIILSFINPHQTTFFAVSDVFPNTVWVFDPQMHMLWRLTLPQV
jgi:hypothetical protein